jgi:long-chain acyl-CoA synthetase
MYPGRHSATHPDKPAVVMCGRKRDVVTYQQLEERSQQIAQLLYSRGLRPGDGFAVFAENHVRYFEMYWAAIRSGLYITAISRYLSPGEAAYLVNDSGAKALFTTKHMATTAVPLIELAPGCQLRFMIDGTEPGFESYEDVVGAQRAEPLADQPRGEVMLYSSGTTGRPKGIRRPLVGLQMDDPSLMGISMMEAALLGMSESTVYLCPAPLYHAAALQWSAGAHELGGTVVIMEKFDAATFLRIVQDERVTHSQVVPTMLVRMLKLPEERRLEYDVSSLERVVHAAAPCPDGVKRRAIDWLGPIVDEYYAATEGPGLTYLNSEQWLAHPGSVGRPVIGIPHICGDDGAELPVGEIGTVWFEREAPTFEYHGDPEKTRQSRHVEHENWAAFGDIGYLDDEGYLYLTDRRAFTIISGGVNIYPAEIESCLVMHPAVTDVAVFGLPDEEMGEYVHAVVQPADGIDATPELAAELITYAKATIAGYKVPKVVDFVDELPRLPTGKLQKAILRDAYRSTPG